VVNLPQDRILIIDGAMGTMIQSKELNDDAYIWENKLLSGFNDVLNLTRPSVIRSIHEEYCVAGADIIETNTFNANYISALEYDLSDGTVDEINATGARIARSVADRHGAYVAGVLGPTSKMLSMSPDVTDPAYREISYQELARAYYRAARNLIQGGAHLILIETVFDTLNAKAAISAVLKLEAALGEKIPIMISGTITDASGRTLSGQTAEAFWNSVKHANPISVGFNCALGAHQLRPYIETLHDCADCAISAHPNAGLPNELGEYDQSPAEMANELQRWADKGLLNIVGGCCGTSPEHIRQIAAAVKKYHPRKPRVPRKDLRLAGLESFSAAGKNFINIGERTNVAGSAKFRRLIKTGDFEAALSVAREQIKNGAQIIDINMDDGLLDGLECMEHFLKLIACEPDIARVPLMIDSSNWDILLAGMQLIQGKGIINSISLKEGEETFLSQAQIIKENGHAVVVMAFDEKGQADTLERRKEVCRRSYQLLVNGVDFPVTDIIFDPNIFPVATGIEAHCSYAVDFIEATRWIKGNLPHAKVSGGISNLSFSFRGNNSIREMMHSIFLYHAINAGMDMGIVNAGQLVVYDAIPEAAREIVEDVILNRRLDGTDRLLDLASKTRSTSEKDCQRLETWRNLTIEERIKHSLINGIDEYIVKDAEEALEKIGDALLVVEGPLMDGMDIVGDLFGSGKMFLPQVVKTARVMKKAVDYLEPYMERGKMGRLSKGKILLATVKGDVHDIGKNIVGVVLACNGYDILDLGVMVPLEKILKTAVEEDVDAIGLSGLITPSLNEMVKVAREMTARKINKPLLIGGATTSEVHTAIKIYPEYRDTVHVINASTAVGDVSRLFKDREGFINSRENRYRKIQERRDKQGHKFRPLKSAQQNKYVLQSPPVSPRLTGRHCYTDIRELSAIIKCIDWRPFARTWGMKPRALQDTGAGQDLLKDAHKYLESLLEVVSINAVCSIDPCGSSGDDVIVYSDDNQTPGIIYNFIRQSPQKRSANRCLSDYIHEHDWIGTFAVWVEGIDELAQEKKDEGNDYASIMIQALGDRLVEAAAEWLHRSVRTDRWGYAPNESFSYEELITEKYQGIRPAPGYPACPDHTQKEKIFEWLGLDDHPTLKLTEGLAMTPKPSICGWYFANSEARYFGVGKVPKEYLEDLMIRNPGLERHKDHLA